MAAVKKIEDMSEDEILEHLKLRKIGILRKLKEKWRKEAEEYGVQFGAVMLFTE